VQLVEVTKNFVSAVNEVHGSMIGDALLVEVATALRGRASEEEIVGRVGGNAFAIFLPNPSSREAVQRRMHEFAEAFAHPFSTGDRMGKEFISLAASVGAAVAPQDGRDVETIFARADAALRAAKQHAGGSCLLYEPAMTEPAQPA